MKYLPFVNIQKAEGGELRETDEHAKKFGFKSSGKFRSASKGRPLGVRKGVGGGDVGRR